MKIVFLIAFLIGFPIKSIAQWDITDPKVYLSDDADRVGIGTSNPGTKFHVLGEGTGSNVATIRVASSDNQAGISFLSDDTGPATIYSPDGSAQLYFSVGGADRLVITEAGVVGIGTVSPSSSYKLSVVGKIRATDVKVEVGWSDFVFDDAYQLMSLPDVDKYIQENGHLPNVPSAETVSAEGVYLGEMQSTLMQKIEELTLYVIDLKKENEDLSERVISLEKTANH